MSGADWTVSVVLNPRLVSAARYALMFPTASGIHTCVIVQAPASLYRGMVMEHDQEPLSTATRPLAMPVALSCLASAWASNHYCIIGERGRRKIRSGEIVVA